MFVRRVRRGTLDYGWADYSRIDLARNIAIAIIKGDNQQTSAPGLEIRLVQHWSNVALKPRVSRSRSAVMSIMLQVRDNN